MIELENLIKEENVIHYDYGCLMVEFNMPGWNQILDQIDPEDVYDNEKKEYGLEKNCHVTLLYGFELDNLDRNKLKSYMEQITPIKLTLTKIAYFDQPDYDVLKFNAQGSYLHKLNKFFREHFKYKSEFENYEPHATIVYLKKGTAKKYIEKFEGIRPINIIGKKLVFTGYSSDDQIILIVKDKSSIKKDMKNND